MVRDGFRIRLTAGKELRTYRALTSCLPSMPDPRTLPGLISRLEAAAHLHEHDKTDPDGPQTASIARNFIAYLAEAGR